MINGISHQHVLSYNPFFIFMIKQYMFMSLSF